MTTSAYRKMVSSTAWCAFVTLLTMSSLPCFAQIARTGLTGVVSDPTGAVIPDVTITITNQATDISQKTVTNGTGVYSFPDLSPGTYNLTGTKQGFATTTIAALTLYVGQTETQNIQLQIGQTSTKVEVTAEPPLLNVNSSTMGTIIESKVLTDIPLNGRNFLQLNLLSPGVTYDKNGNVATSINANINPSEPLAAFNVGGMPGDFNEMHLDGTSMKEWQYATNSMTPSVDAIEEFQIATGSYSAAYGTDGGGQINLVTKSGTNQLHGDAFDFLRNNKLDAKNFFVATPNGAPPYKRNQYGGTVGGPIILPHYNGRDKTFFFVSYEAFRNTKQVPEVANFPTLQELQGNLSPLVPAGKQLINYSTGQPFTGNTIPQNMIPAKLEAFLLTGGAGGTPWFPLPNSTVPGADFNTNATEAYRSDQWIYKLDHRISNNASVFARFANENYTRDLPVINPNDTETDNTSANNLAGGLTITFKPNLLFHVTYGQTHMWRSFHKNTTGKVDIAAEMGIQGMAVAPNTWVAPDWGVTGFSLAGNGYSSPESTQYREYDVNPALNWNVGRHNLNIGGEITRFFNTFPELICPAGCPSFNGEFSGQALGDFLLQTPSSFEASSTGFNALTGYTGQGYYIQDDWKVTSRLTLNLGFRFESIGVPVSANNSMSNVYLPGPGGTPVVVVPPNAKGITFFGVQQTLVPAPGVTYVSPQSVGLPNSLVHGPARNYTPRLGFAYQLPGMKDTVVRGGVAQFSNRVNDNRWVDLSINSPFVAIDLATFNPANFGTFNWQNPLAGTAGGAVLFCGNEPYFKSAQISEWSLTVERSWQDILFSVGYTGNTAYHLPDLEYPNQARPGPGAYAPRRPYPTYGTIYWQENAANSDYNGLQAKIQRNYAKGLTLTAAYTFSKGIDDSSGDINGEGNGGSPQDFANRRDDRGLSLQNAAQRFVLSYIYALPVGRGHHLATGRAENAVLGGWQVNGITTFQSGNPVFVSQSCNRANTDQGTQRPDLAGPWGSWNMDTGRPSGQLVSEFFNTAAFTNVCPNLAGSGPFTFGNAGRNIVIGPGINDWDFGLFKNIPLHSEHRSLQFRGEFFNLFNHPIFAQPGGSAGTPTFGKILATALDSREIQLALKLIF